MYGWRIDGLAMAEFNIDIGKLPEDVREKLAELDLELSEGNPPGLPAASRRTRQRGVERNSAGILQSQEEEEGKVDVESRKRASGKFQSQKEGEEGKLDVELVESSGEISTPGRRGKA
ncbi:hypothetical protein WN55_09181 [Dufourea novaeangliae]|uniref:Uncharacterized protein n=1 Tax=Dufourea novaeangliae TaxID=178035 RepID=A0A154PAM8_DUFNO|nr:hypothetical protein WN55_09181 [Dufourea novaeangliae]